MRVVITGGDGDIAQAIAAQLSELHEVFTPGRLELDVRMAHMVHTYMIRVRPDILINNAGRIAPASVIESSNGEWREQIEVNLMGTYFCTKYALEEGCKQIINIGSSAGAKGKEDWSAYCAAKAGVERLTESLHEEGYNATCFRIGRTRTKMRAALFGEEDPATLLAPDRIARLVHSAIQRPEMYSGQVVEVRV